MPDEYLALVNALKSISQGGECLPVAENGWSTSPNQDSYGIVQLDFEADAMDGDDRKVAEAYEGSFDLYSLSKTGDGWIPYVRSTLTAYCGGCWRLNLHTYETGSRLFHWEWVFQIEGD